MSDLSNEKILEILKTEGKIEAIKYVKETLKVDTIEAKKLVDEVASKDPDTKSPKPSQLSAYIALAVIIIAVWVGCNMCGDDNEPPVTTRKERIEKLFSAWDGSQPEVEKWIKQNIKDPDSYKHIETRFADKLETVSVITKFTATNSFGGRVQSTCIAQIDTLGKLLSAQITE